MANINYEGIGQIEAVFNQGTQAWLRKVLMDLTGEAQRRAPKDEGSLRAAGHWQIDGHNSGRVIFDMPYAAVQHERIDFTHTDGEAKYLENPLREKGPAYEAELAAILRSRIR